MKLPFGNRASEPEQTWRRKGDREAQHDHQTRKRRPRLLSHPRPPGSNTELCQHPYSRDSLGAQLSSRRPSHYSDTSLAIWTHTPRQLSPFYGTVSLKARKPKGYAIKSSSGPRQFSCQSFTRRCIITDEDPLMNQSPSSSTPSWVTTRTTASPLLEGHKDDVDGYLMGNVPQEHACFPTCASRWNAQGVSSNRQELH